MRGDLPMFGAVVSASAPRRGAMQIPKLYGKGYKK